MLDYNTLIPIYDFSLIEKAVQDFFIALPTGSFVKPANEDDPNREQWTPGAGNIPFYTPTQAGVLQSCRPRVGILENNFAEIPSARILDADGTYRAMAWRATMRFGIVTETNYHKHRQFRAMICAILPQCQPNPDAIGTTGLNQFLQYHELATFAMQAGDTAITPEKGYYMSMLTVNLTFSVRATAWPGGTLTS